MEIKEILSKVDHTLLKPESTWEQIKEICDDGIKYETPCILLICYANFNIPQFPLC